MDLSAMLGEHWAKISSYLKSITRKFCQKCDQFVQKLITNLRSPHFVNKAIKPLGKKGRMRNTDLKIFCPSRRYSSWISWAAKFPHCNSEPVDRPLPLPCLKSMVPRRSAWSLVALFNISIWHIDCRYIDTFEKYRYRYRYGEVENIDIDIDIDRAILKNIDIDIDIDKEILENIDIDIDKEILENIDIDKILNRLEFGISNRATLACALSWEQEAKSLVSQSLSLKKKLKKEKKKLKKLKKIEEIFFGKPKFWEKKN